MESMRKHLKLSGLTSKDPEKLQNGASVGTRSLGEHDQLRWQQGSRMEDGPLTITRRGGFSMCDQLMGHFPVCGELQMATGFIKL